jgi:hypothetical protein
MSNWGYIVRRIGHFYLAQLGHYYFPVTLKPNIVDADLR